MQQKERRHKEAVESEEKSVERSFAEERDADLNTPGGVLLARVREQRLQEEHDDLLKELAGAHDVARRRVEEGGFI